MIRTSRLMSPALLAATVVALTSCGGGSEGTDGPSTDAPVVTEAAGSSSAPTTDALATDPAESARCGVVVDRDSDEGEYELIACDEPHDAEFAGFVDVASSATAAPGDLAARIELMTACAPAVEALVGRTLSEFGIDVGVVRDRDGSSPDTVECWAQTLTPDVLTGTLTEVDLGAALGDAKLLQSNIDPGECFAFFEFGSDIVSARECDAPDAQQVAAVVVLEGDQYPGEDGVTEQAFERCEEAIRSIEFDLVSAEYGVVYPLEDGWTALGQRGAICVTSSAGADADPDLASEPETASAGDPCGGSSDDFFPVVDCDTPHISEFAGAIPPPVDVLPADVEEAKALMLGACAPVVSDFLERDTRLPGIGVGFSVSTGFGEPIVDDVWCYADADESDGLIGSIAEVGLDAALTKIIVFDQEPGTCFLLGESNFSLGDPVECAAPDALMFIGNVELDDGPYPGDDVIREIRAVVCAELLATSGLAADPASVSGTFPSESNWNDLGRRNLVCDAAPV